MSLAGRGQQPCNMSGLERTKKHLLYLASHNSGHEAPLNTL